MLHRLQKLALVIAFLTVTIPSESLHLVQARESERSNLTTTPYIRDLVERPTLAKTLFKAKTQEEVAKEVNEQVILEKEKQLLKEVEQREIIESTFTPITPYNFSSTKSYMDSRSVTSKSSPQWRLKQRYLTDSMGHHYVYEDNIKYYAIAMGSYYGTIGDKFKITLSSGVEFYAIIGDQKKDSETFEGKYHLCDGSTIEFIVNVDVVRQAYPNFKGGFQTYEQWGGVIESMSKKTLGGN